MEENKRSSEPKRTYMCIDLRSYYASVECVARGLDPMTARLVVADPERGRGTICLAVSPAMKASGIRNRCRVHEIPRGMEYIMATPRMQRYIDVSGEVYGTYLDFVSSDDVHVYSVDECFIDATGYLPYYRKTPREFAQALMSAVLERTGIPSTCGIGPNLFLCKVALDVEAKHSPGGIAQLDSKGFRERIWHHRPITDIWGISHGIEKRLARHGLVDLYDVAHAPPEVMRREFGINGEILQDHAWGLEPCTIKQIKEYVPRSHSVSCGQVLMRDYSKAEARTVMWEMAHEAVLELAERHSICGSYSVSVGYSFDKGPECAEGASTTRYLYGARDGGTRKLAYPTAAASKITPRLMALFDEVADPAWPIRRLSVGLGALIPEEMEALPLFCDAEAMEAERKLLAAIVAARRKYGRDAIMWGASLFDCATGYERARQIGGHRA